MKTSILFAAIIVGMASCTQKGEQTQTTSDTTSHISTSANPEVARIETRYEFRTGLTTAFESYLALKDAFVESDPALVSTLATAAKTLIETLPSGFPAMADSLEWANVRPQVLALYDGMVSEKDLEVQRKKFSDLSNEWTRMIQKYGLEGKVAYVEYCPMAFNNSGATWLSDTTIIRNPYFGDKMLTCGSVRDTLR